MFEAYRLWQYPKFTPHEAFRYTYVISRDIEDLPDYTHNFSDNCHIYSGNGLPVCRLHDQQGRVIGVLLGIAVAPSGLISEQNSLLPLDKMAADFWDQFEHYLVDVAGRYAFILDCAGHTRLYTDPVGMIGAVYNAQDHLAAATPLLAIKRPLIPNPKFDLDIVENHAGKFSLFHTPDEHVRRLNPNHYLDLDSFTETRFWPKNEDFATPPQNMLGAYEQLYDITKHNIDHIVSNYPTSLPLSGGQDSRLLVAFARTQLPKVQQIYTHINNYATLRDATIAAEIMRAINHTHEIHDKDDYQVSGWQSRKLRHIHALNMGAPASPPMEYLNGAIQGVKAGNVVMRGHLTDLLRAVYVLRPKEYWDKPDWQIKRLLIVPGDMFTKAIADRFRPDFQAWQADLPANAHEKAADFMFMEIYMNATVGATFPSLWRNFYLSPFNSRRLITLALRFPETIRRRSQPVFDIIERYCPPISGIPFDFEVKAPLEMIKNARYRTKSTERRRRFTNLRLKEYEAALPKTTKPGHFHLIKKPS